MKHKFTRTIKLIGSGWNKASELCAGGGIGVKDCNGYAEIGQKFCSGCRPVKGAAPLSPEDLKDSMRAPKNMGENKKTRGHSPIPVRVK